MAYTKSPRPYAHEYQLQKNRIAANPAVHTARMERQTARRTYDAKGINRTGKDISHNKMLSKGGSNKDGTRLESPGANRSRNGKVKGST
jgi:hypothetical protein